ncbi:MAG: type I glutamate--ammonia ligase [Thermacetogeniaceae bacterium]
MTPEEVLAFAKQKGIAMVDLKFNDLPGLWQHFTIPISELSAEIFTEGIGFDGSSIRGFQEIHESDMLLIPDPGTALLDPICKAPTLSMICEISDPITHEPYSRDPRYVAKKAEAYLKKTGIADTSYWGPEMEFFIFDDIRFDQSVNFGYYFIDSVEGEWNTGRDEEPNLGYKPRYKEGYFPVPPHDSQQDLRTEMVMNLIDAGIGIETHHHEVASGGQAEIDMKFDTLTVMADKCLLYKYIVKNVARRHNKVVTFMPKPLFQDNGSGMHTHQSLWKDGTNLFFDANGYALLSKTAKNYAAGLLKHAPALLAFCAPTTNSYKRLVPGFEAPVNLVYSMRNRSAAIRIPTYSANPKARRIEFRPPDCTCNPYLSFAALLMAGLDGVKNNLDPGDPVDKNIYELPAEEASKIKQVPASFEEALDALEADHDFLLEGGVFTEDLLDVWIRYKREREIDAIRLRPHPYEYHLYFDL